MWRVYWCRFFGDWQNYTFVELELNHPLFSSHVDSLMISFCTLLLLMRQRGMQWCHLQIAYLLMQCLACPWCKKGRGYVPVLIPAGHRLFPFHENVLYSNRKKAFYPSNCVLSPFDSVMIKFVG